MGWDMPSGLPLIWRSCCVPDSRWVNGRKRLHRFALQCVVDARLLYDDLVSLFSCRVPTTRSSLCQAVHDKIRIFDAVGSNGQTASDACTERFGRYGGYVAIVVYGEVSINCHQHKPCCNEQQKKENGETSTPVNSCQRAA